MQRFTLSLAAPRLLALTLVPTLALGLAPAAHANEPPLAGSRCASAALVEPKFRDAALTALEQLMVRAPGHRADGAVRSHHSAGHVDSQGHGWHQVSAYQANLGLIGALNVSPQLLPTVADWLRWQARHIAPVGELRGVVLDHWVRADSLEESTCPPGMAAALCRQVDAYDSTAASTLLMADAYLRHGGERQMLREPAVRQALEAAAATLRALTTAEGLTLAKPGYPVAYTMDAVEVLAGWRAWARLQRDAFAEPQSAVNTFKLAERGHANVQTRLWDEARGLWRVGLGADAAHGARWYPDTMAQAWPLLWDEDADSLARSGQAWRRAIARWQGTTHWARQTADPEGFWWPAAAVAAHCTGDAAAARTWVERARARWLDPAAPFAWPFQVGDLLWLLWLAEPQMTSPGAVANAPSLPPSPRRVP